MDFWSIIETLCILFGEQRKMPPIPREVVDAVYRRDGGRCVYCGLTENLQLLCQKCNLEKSNKIG